MKKVSVIVPIYKVEKYLADCIESIITQSYQNIELILVDDGSPDKSGEIAEEYAKKDDRIKVIHKPNGGLSDARNAGMEKATGDYLMFIDSDDLMMPDAIKVLEAEITQKQADYVIANYTNCDDDGTLWEKPVFSAEKYKGFKLDIKDYVDSFFIMNSGVWNKMFDRKFVESLNLKFEIGLPAEDAIFTTYCFIKSSKVYYIPNIVYCYRQRGAGTSISMSCTHKYFDGINIAYRKIYDNFKENEELGFYRFFYAKSMTYMLYKFIDSTMMDDDEKREVIKEMSWFYNISDKLKIEPCQKSLKILIRKIADEKYDEVIDICRIIADMRSFIPEANKEKMSKPTDILYEKLEEEE